MVEFISEHHDIWVAGRCLVMAALTGGALLVLWRHLSRRLEEWARRSPLTWDEDLLGKLSPLAKVMIAIAAVSAGLAFAPSDVLHELADLRLVLRIAVIGTIFLAIERVATVLFHVREVTTAGGGNLRLLGLTVVRILLGVIGLATILDALGIAITPIVASLGIGSIAVALALQDTLGNLFSGLYILIDQPVRIGDFIRLEGDEGHVEKIGWRSTQVRLLSNNLIVIPNSKLAGARIVNFALPTPETWVSVEVGVSYNSDLDHVERVALRVAQETLDSVVGGVTGSEPSVRFNQLADSAINLNISFRARQYVDSYFLKHEFIKRLHRTFKSERIEIPYPQREIRVRRAKSGA